MRWFYFCNHFFYLWPPSQRRLETSTKLNSWPVSHCRLLLPANVHRMRHRKIEAHVVGVFFSSFFVYLGGLGPQHMSLDGFCICQVCPVSEFERIERHT